MDSGDAWCGLYAVVLTMPSMGLAGAMSDAASSGVMQGTLWWHFSLVLCALLNASCLLLFGIAIELLWARVRRSS